MQRTVSSVSLGFMITLSLVLCDLTLAGTRSRGRTLVSPQQSTNQTGVRSTKLAQDRGWPRGYSLPSEAQIVLFEPQFASWENQKLAVAFAAVSYVAKGGQKPALGTIKIETETQVSLEQRLVKFSRLKVTETNFQTLAKEQTRELVDEIEKKIPDEDRIITLDRVLAYIDKSTISPKNVAGLKSDPPKIYMSQTPAILVSFDGEPIWSPIKGNELKFAVNTNWDVFQHPPTGLLYLRNDTSWLKSTQLTGPWSHAGKLPNSFNKLPEDENWKEVRANLPGAPVKELPSVYVNTEPAELIQIRGIPNYEPVANTQLLWVSNTESDLFRVGKDGAFFYLVTGRWFSAPSLTGPWTFATPTLPEAFKIISLEHPRSRVLASVPGTQQAAEAVLLAQVPQIARVNKKDLSPPEVTYHGEPEFEVIQGTQLERAKNTASEIIKVGDVYYLCFQGIWFTAGTPKGPWTIASSIPDDVYEIPPSSPSHSVTYVTLEQDENEEDDWVTFAAYAGYTGLMVGWGCAVWGTGWYYPPYYWYGGYYPVYYPHWRTYGYGSWYNPYTGRYGTAGRIYGPYGGVGFGARYNPSTGTYARGAFAYGPYGARGAAEAYNPRTGAYASTRQGSGVYGSWGSTHVQRGDDWVNTKRFTSSAGNTTRVTRTDQGGVISRRSQDGRGFIGSNGENVYAGRDGNVYRRDQNGNWNKWENGNWNSVQRPEQNNSVRDSMLNDRARQQERQAPTRPSQGDSAKGERTGQSRPGNQMDPSTFRGLERDRAARTEGNQRSRDFGSYNRNYGNAGGYRGGGFSRGGGGFRGGGRRR